MLEKIGNDIKKYRIENGLTQQQFAELVNLDRSTISQYENNSSNPSKKTSEKIYKIISNDYSYKLEEVNIIKWRMLEDVSFETGNNITLISGQNGTGKSNLLSLIASTSGNSSFKSMIRYSKSDRTEFHPSFGDYFYIAENELLSNYKVSMTYSYNYNNSKKFYFSKTLRMKNDIRSQRGVRLIPDTEIPSSNKDYESKTEFSKETERIANVTSAGRVPIPTKYVSISRVYPLGEAKATYKEIDDNIFNEELKVLFQKYYNAIIPGSIVSIDNGYNISKPATGMSSLHLPINSTTPLTQSVGQDNLSFIISSLVDFHNISKEPNYVGGILCIDEIDVSLHPDAQIKLIQILKSISEQLNLQIFLSSHSLTVIKEISNLSQKYPHDYKIVYLKEPDQPYISEKTDYDSIKIDLFNKIYAANKPKIKIYFEDDMGIFIFSQMKNAYYTIVNSDNDNIKDFIEKLKNLDPDFSIIDPIQANISCNDAFNFVKIDDYFETIGFILDGDAKISRINDGKKYNSTGRDKREYKEFLIDVNKNVPYSKKTNIEKNIVFLPNDFPPEFYLYRIIYKYLINHDDFMFWRNIDSYCDNNYTKTTVKESLKVEQYMDKDNLYIRDFKKSDLITFITGFVKDSNILADYYMKSENQKEFINFFKEYNKSIVHLKNKNYKKLI